MKTVKDIINFKFGAKRKLIFLIVLLFLSFAVSFFLYSHNNNFPYFYHMTEDTKVDQISTGVYNFNHPLLMLNATHVLSFLNADETYQQKCETGRFVSAIFSSFSILFLVAIAFLLYGFVGATVSAIILPFSPMLLKLSHYFKEDPTFLFGITLTFFALALYYEKPSFKRIAFVGIASALCASGKYVGFIMLPMTLVSVLMFPKKDNILKSIKKCKRVKYYLCSFFATYFIANIQLITQFSSLAKRIASKFGSTVAKKSDAIVAFSGHGSAQVKSPIIEYVKYFMFHQTSIIIPILTLLYFCFFVATYKKRSAIEKFMVAFFFFFTILLSLGKVASGQYFLPQEMLCHLFSAFLLYHFAMYLKKKIGETKAYALLSVFVAVLVFLLFPFSSKIMMQHDITYDTRQEMVQWISENLPQNSNVCADSYVHIEEMFNVIEKNKGIATQKNLRCREIEYVGDLRSIENAKKMGFTHLAICSSNYNRFFTTSVMPANNFKDVFSVRQNFYNTLLKTGKLVWKSEAVCGGVINKSIKLFSVEQ